MHMLGCITYLSKIIKSTDSLLKTIFKQFEYG